MGSFGMEEREQFGHSVRLAMACIEGTGQPITGNALPSEVQAIGKRLLTLTQEHTSAHADILELLVRFDDLQGWKTTGARHCANWIDRELNISA